jgi:hypothetical protein
MINRIYKVLGKCFSDSGSTNIELFVNNNILFNDSVTATTEPTPERMMHEDLEELFSFTLPVTEPEKISIKIKVNGGDCWFSSLSANYSGYVATWKDEQSPVQIMEDPGTMFNNQTYDPPHEDNKTNVFLNGIDITATENVENTDNPNDTTGWHYLIPAGSELTLDYFIDPDWIVLSVPDTPPMDDYPVLVENRRGQLSIVSVNPQ